MKAKALQAGSSPRSIAGSPPAAKNAFGVTDDDAATASAEVERLQRRGKLLAMAAENEREKVLEAITLTLALP